MDKMEFFGHYFSKLGMQLSHEWIQCIYKANSRARFFEARTSSVRNDQQLPGFYKWTVRSSDTRNNVTQKKCGRHVCDATTNGAKIVFEKYQIERNEQL